MRGGPAGLIRHKGASVTVSLAGGSATYDEDAGTWSGVSATTVAGYMMRVDGDPERYQALKLVESEAPTFEFTPTTANEIPPIGGTFSHGSGTYVVRDVQPVMYNGSATTRSSVVGVGVR